MPLKKGVSNDSYEKSNATGRQHDTRNAPCELRETTFGEKAHATLSSTFWPFLNSVGNETGRASNRTTTTAEAVAVVRDCERDRSHVI